MHKLSIDPQHPLIALSRNLLITLIAPLRDSVNGVNQTVSDRQSRFFIAEK